MKNNVDAFTGLRHTILIAQIDFKNLDVVFPGCQVFPLAG